MTNVVNINRRLAVLNPDFSGGPVERIRNGVERAFARIFKEAAIRREGVDPRLLKHRPTMRKPVAIVPSVKACDVMDAMTAGIRFPVDEDETAAVTPARAAALGVLVYLASLGNDAPADLVSETTDYIDREMSKAAQIAANVSPFLVADLDSKTGRKLTAEMRDDAADYVTAIIEYAYMPHMLAIVSERASA